MASVKADKPVGTQLFGHVKKEPAATSKAGDGSSKPAAKKAAQKPQEPKKKKKGKAGKAATKQ